MAGKKITLELTPAEFAHAQTALRQATEAHRAEHGRGNASLDRVLKKMDGATEVDEGDGGD